MGLKQLSVCTPLSPCGWFTLADLWVDLSRALHIISPYSYLYGAGGGGGLLKCSTWIQAVLRMTYRELIHRHLWLFSSPRAETLHESKLQKSPIPRTELPHDAWDQSWIIIHSIVDMSVGPKVGIWFLCPESAPFFFMDYVWNCISAWMEMSCNTRDSLWPRVVLFWKQKKLTFFFFYWDSVMFYKLLSTHQCCNVVIFSDPNFVSINWLLHGLQ